jgi:AcrR family transcriptional regulator
VPADRSRPYHHGDLKAALVDAAVQLIAERGVRGFSMAELSRRLGVTVGAPYRHFADRDELLAAVAIRALGMFKQALAKQALAEQALAEQALAEQAAAADPPERRLAAIASGYVRFAAQQRALFSVVFGFGLDKKSRYPQLRQAYEEVEDMLGSCVAALCPGDPDGAERLADAIEATAHGYATLLIDQPGAPDPDAVERAADQAASATLALIRGREALRDG